MENFNAQKFIEKARQQGVPDEQTFNYLNSKGLIPKESVVTNTPPEKSFIQKAGDTINSVLPGKQLGTAVGNSIYGLSQLAKGNMDEVRKVNAENNQNFSRVAGDVAQSAILPASLALNPTKTVLGGAAQLGATSALGTAAQTVAEGGGTGDAAKNAFYSGLTGAVTGGAIGAIGKTLSKLADKAPEAIYNNALKITQKVKSSGNSPSSFLVNEKVWGGLGTFKKAADEGIATAKQAIEPKLANTPGSLDFSKVEGETLDYLKKKYGKIYSEKQLKEVVDSIPANQFRESKVLNWTDSNGVREQLDKLLGDRFYLSSAQPSLIKDATSAMTDSIRNNVKKATGTEKEFAAYRKWIQTDKAVKRAIDLADQKFGLGLRDSISLATGTTGGLITGDTAKDKGINGLIGGASSLALTRGFASPSIQTGFAQLIKNIDSIPTDTAGKISKAALIQAFGSAFSNSDQAN